MTVKRTTRSATSPAGVTRVRAASKVKTAARKSTAKKRARKKSPVRKSATRKKAVKRSPTAAAKVRASVTARKQTIDATTRHEDAATLKIDAADEAAQASIAKKTAAWRKAAERNAAIIVSEAESDEVEANEVDAADDPANELTRPPSSAAKRRRTAVDRVSDPPPATGGVLIERVSRAIERELNQIEAIVGGRHVNRTQRTEGERRARTLASLARTLREVMTLRAGEQKKAKGDDDDAVPRDLTTLRLALARRLEQLVAEAKTTHPGSAE